MYFTNLPSGLMYSGTTYLFPSQLSFFSSHFACHRRTHRRSTACSEHKWPDSVMKEKRTSDLLYMPLTHLKLANHGWASIMPLRSKNVHETCSLPLLLSSHDCIVKLHILKLLTASWHHSLAFHFSVFRKHLQQGIFKHCKRRAEITL